MGSWAPLLQRMKRSRDQSEQHTIRLQQHAFLYYNGLGNSEWMMMHTKYNQMEMDGRIMEFRTIRQGWFVCVEDFSVDTRLEFDLDLEKMDGIFDPKNQIFYVKLGKDAGYLTLVDDDKRPQKTQMLISDMLKRH